MLLLLPAVLLLLLPLIDLAMRRLHIRQNSETVSTLLSLFILGALVLCVRLGFLVEKWMRAPAASALLAVLWGVLLIFLNFTIALVGCATLL